MRFVSLFLTTIVSAAVCQNNLRGGDEDLEFDFSAADDVAGVDMVNDLINKVEEYNANKEYEWQYFEEFRQKFKKSYESLEKFEERFVIFKDNLRFIMEHNMNKYKNFTLGVNQFSDLTQEEFKKAYLNSKKPLGSYGCQPFSATNSGLPPAIDWRDKGVVNPVRDQGQCGSCWAFATTANAESVWALNKGQLYDLSEEFLVDCATGRGYNDMGCNGGNPDSAFKYMINNGQCAESSYPYTAGVTQKAGTCHSCTSIVSFGSCYDVKPYDQVSLKAAVARQPVVIAIDAETRYFQSYSGGILTDEAKCQDNLDHAVEIIGYGEENGIKFWTVRNSWGESWGEEGYVRIERSESTDDEGVCGVAAEPSYLTV